MSIICWVCYVVYSTLSGEIGISVCFCSDMGREPQTRAQIVWRQGGRGSHKGKERREGERGSTARESVKRDTDQDLEAVLLCPVIDERQSDKEKEERTERVEHGNGGVKKGQQKAFYYLLSNGAVGEWIRAEEKCQSHYSGYNGKQESSAETHSI